MKTNIDRTSLEDKFKGCILGAAIGDALGMPTEYLSSKEELNHYFKGPVRDFQKAPFGQPCAHLEAGQYTDDTQQIIILANSLIKNKGFNFKDFAKGIGDKTSGESALNRSRRPVSPSSISFYRPFPVCPFKRQGEINHQRA